MMMSEKPSWHFGLIDWDGPFHWNTIKREEMRSVLDTLKSLESNTWQEITTQQGKRNHFIDCEDICKEARDRLVQIRQDDVASLFSCRVASLPRIWGIAHGAVLKILWWDPEHRICPSEKKNT